MLRASFGGLALWAALSVPLHPARADWTELALPNLPYAFAPVAMAHLPDGRFVYGEAGQISLQAAFGYSIFSPFSGEPAVDPSFIAIHSEMLAVVGAGTFGPSALYRFDPFTPATPAFAALGPSVQNYQGVFRDANGLYIGGTYTGFTHGIRYVSLDGLVSRIIVSNVATFSAGMAIDGAGNLFVGDTDNGEVRRFTPAQLGAAIAGPALRMNDGELVHDFGSGGNIGSLAVDGLGRIWAAGWQHNGLRVYDPALGLATNVTPSLDNANYTVLTFRRAGIDYVAYINQADPFTDGSPMTYGYCPAASAVPLPAHPDFDNDARADRAVYLPALGRWYVDASTEAPIIADFGWADALPCAADYDGDTVTDRAVYHPASGNWYVRESASQQTRIVPWGWADALPAPADYDGDGRTDPAVYHPASGNWYVRESATGSNRVQNWGWSHTVPVPADYDGDHRADLAVYHPHSGNWFIRFSRGTATNANWGYRDALPAPADYDGDGRADLAVYQPQGGRWSIAYSAGGTRIIPFGWDAASPAPADYDGDGRADPTVLHRPSGSWYHLASETGAPVTAQWGWSALEPVLPQWQVNRWMNRRLRLWPVP